MTIKQEATKSAKEIIKNGTCVGVHCSKCPYYYETQKVDCCKELGDFHKNGIDKINWFKKWLIKNENSQLELEF